MWFTDKKYSEYLTDRNINNLDGFRGSISYLAKELNEKLKVNGHAVLVVGDKSSKSKKNHPSDTVIEIFEKVAPKLQIADIINDSIPDVRRSRRSCRAVKEENIIIFCRENK